MPQTETFEFQAETTRLLNLVINSLYTTKDIFLRELISNASDALDRLRFESLSRKDLVPEDHPYEIRLEPNPDNRTLTIHDTGIGMSREEIIRNLGTIAQSGTRELLQQAAEGKNRELLSSLIGQFGVGFYSVFMVADRVSVISRRAGEEDATFWESSGEGRFDISTASRESCGTTITLHLKAVDEEAGIHDYTDWRVLRDIVKRYSDFITFPVYCPVETTEYERDGDGRIKEGTEPRKVVKTEILNAMKPIWTRASKDVTEDEYAEFYQHISHDWNKPLKTIAVKAEGRIEYRALLFIPSQPPFELAPGEPHWGLQLYAKSVMIMEECQDLLPPWLRFIRGVVDSADLPLNISREMLQQDRHILQIRRYLSSKIVKTLENMKKNETEDYLKFWKAFGRILKEGVALDREAADSLRPLLLFKSSAHTEKLVSLDEYVSRMKVQQDSIYYLTGESRTVIENSPHLEAFLEKGFEVLYLDDPVDELLVQVLREHEGRKLKSVARGEVDFEKSDKEEDNSGTSEKESGKERFAGLFESLQKHLDQWVREIRVSARLRNSPACLVAGEYDISPQLEKILRANGQDPPPVKRILELNPGHEILEGLLKRYEKNPEDDMIAETAELLYGYALLAEGGELPDPARFTKLLARRMQESLSDS